GNYERALQEVSKIKEWKHTQELTVSGGMNSYTGVMNAAIDNAINQLKKAKVLVKEYPRKEIDCISFLESKVGNSSVSKEDQEKCKTLLNAISEFVTTTIPVVNLEEQPKSEVAQEEIKLYFSPTQQLGKGKDNNAMFFTSRETAIAMEVIEEKTQQSS